MTIETSKRIAVRKSIKKWQLHIIRHLRNGSTIYSRKDGVMRWSHDNTRVKAIASDCPLCNMFDYCHECPLDLIGHECGNHYSAYSLFRVHMDLYSAREMVGVLRTAYYNI